MANTLVANALRVVSVERGYDPSDFTLVAFGGAGPLHACDVAESMRISRILVPPFPGVNSAVGMTLAEPMRDYSRALPVRTRPMGSPAAREVTESAIREAVDALSVEARHELGEAALLEPSVDMRYEGQGYELNVPFTGDLVSSFHAAHERRFGQANRTRPVEAVTVRVRARLKRDYPREPLQAQADTSPDAARTGSRKLLLDGEREAPVYDRARLQAGNRIQGPAIIAQFDSTTLLQDGWQCEVDSFGNLVLSRS